MRLRNHIGAYHKTDRIIFSSLFVLWLIVLLRITVFRHAFFPIRLFTGGQVVFIPFAGYLGLLSEGKIYYFIYLFFGNIGWFLPLGAFCKIMTNLSRKKILLLGAGLSLSIEILQFVFGTGVSEVDDLILNTVGTLCGILMVEFARQVKKSRKDR